jgi:protein SCO1/2
MRVGGHLKKVRNRLFVQNKYPSNTSILPTLLVSLLVTLLGAVLFFYSTFQGHALTTEYLRQAELIDHPKKIPNFLFIDATNQELSFDQIIKNNQRVLIVDFIYTRCQTVCIALSTSFQSLQETLLKRGLQDQIGLLSISFDPEHDDAQALKRYQQRFRMDERVWQVLSLKDPKDRQNLLDTFGIMVIPAPLDEFEHNAAFHIVSKNYLYQIIDINQAEKAFEAALLVRGGLAQ